MKTFDYEPSLCIPFRDKRVIERCRKLTRAQLVRHPNPDFQIKIVKDEDLAFIISIQGTVSSWQRLTTRLCLHGPVTPRVPGSLLQTLRTDVFVTENSARPIEQTWDLGY
jgi:hypothetical protein